tara:strand:- start:650 stop:1882 length:1233 start_codon:yes stop_codon:yes gene_type:complete
MSVLKLILGFIVGGIACVILIALISIRSPILAGADAITSKNAEIARAEISDEVEQNVNKEEADSELNAQDDNDPVVAESETPTEDTVIRDAIIADITEPDSVDTPTETTENTQTDATNPEMDLEEETIPEVAEAEVTVPEQPIITSGLKKAGNTLTLGSGSSRLPSVSTENQDEVTQPTIIETVSAFTANSNAIVDVEGPVLSIILVDIGATGVVQSELLKQTFPFAFAVNAARSDAGFVTSDYRDAGFEVVALLNGAEVEALTSGEAAVALVKATLANIPDALAVVDDPMAALQKNRRLFAPVLESLLETGQGILGFKGGLSTMGQAAMDLNVPSGQVYRYLDDTITDKTAVARIVDRATVEAAKDGVAIIMAVATPVNVQGLTDWVNSNDGRKVTLVPISTAMSRLSN